MKVIWLQPALDSFSDVLDYSIEYFGTRIATRTEEEIFSAIDKLERLPYLGQVMPEISNDIVSYRRINVNKLLSVIYRVEGDIIYIMFIWDNRRSLHNIYYFFNDL